MRRLTTRRLARFGRLLTLPATRNLIIAAARSPTIRTVTHRVAYDRAGLLRDLRRPAKVRDLLLRGARHSAAGDLACVGLVFLPARYVPLGTVATWAARRILGHYVGLTDRAAQRPIEAGGPDPLTEARSSGRVVVALNDT